MSKQSVDVNLFAERFSELLANSNETTYTLADRLSLSPGTISRYQNGIISPKMTAVNALAELFNVNPDWLRGEKDARRTVARTEPKNGYSEKIASFPVLGSIAAGYDSYADAEQTGDTVSIPQTYLKGRDPSEFFVLQITGDSMYPLYIEGDLVLIRRQNTATRSGQICAVVYENDKATLKRVEYNRGRNRLRLIPINPNYPPLTIEGEELEQCKILGVPKMVLREVND